MKKLLPALAVLALAGCADFGATVASPQANVTAPSSAAPSSSASPLPVDAPYETDMTACRGGSDDCARRAVLRTGSEVFALRDDSGSWLTLTESVCVDGTCRAVDETGVEWQLER